MKITQITFLLILLSLTPTQIFSQTPNFTGTWILNLEKSNLEDQPDGLTGSIFIIEQDGDNFKLTRYHIYGDKKNKISFSMVADGKTRRVKILFKGQLLWSDNNLQASLWRKDFSNVVNYKFGINENEFIADEVMKSKYDNHHNVWVFDREIVIAPEKN